MEIPVDLGTSFPLTPKAKLTDQDLDYEGNWRDVFKTGKPWRIHILHLSMG